MSDDDFTIELTTNIVAAYVGNNPIAPSDVSELIRSVHQSLGALDQSVAEPESTQVEPAVPVSKSVKRKQIVCLECGQGFKTIKRHLGSAHDLQPDANRDKRGLKSNYPMVAPEYARRRSAFAKKIGLGKSAA